MSIPAGKRRPPNKGSILLSDQENQVLFSHFEGDSRSLQAGVVQLLAADPPSRTQWAIKETGIVCLVKDFGQRAYFIRLYDLSRGKIWEQKLYDGFHAKSAGILLSFEGMDKVYGLNFSNAQEAKLFFAGLEKRHQIEMKTKQRSREKENAATTALLPQQQQQNASAGGNQPTAAVASRGGISDQNVTVASGGYNDLLKPRPESKKQKKKKAEKKKKLTPNDISEPTGFLHQSHLGWGGGAVGMESWIHDGPFIDPSIKNLIEQAGIKVSSEDEMKFVRGFLEDHGGMDKAKDDFQQFLRPEIPPPAPVRPGPPAQPGSDKRFEPGGDVYNWVQQQQNERPTPANPPPPPPPPHSKGMMRPPAIPSQPPPPPPPRMTDNIQQPPPQRMGSAMGVSSRQTGGRPKRPLPQPPSSAPPPPPTSRPANLPPAPPAPGGVPAPPAPPPPPPAPGPPPPPPPPPGGAMGAAPKAGGGARADLLASIRNFKKDGDAGKGGLRHVSDGGAAAPSRGGRDMLMDAIKSKPDLKHLDRSEPARRLAPEDAGGIVGALAKALAERRKDIRPSDSESSGDSDEEEAEDEEWED